MVGLTGVIPRSQRKPVLSNSFVAFYRVYERTKAHIPDSEVKNLKNLSKIIYNPDCRRYLYIYVYKYRRQYIYNERNKFVRYVPK